MRSSWPGVMITLMVMTGAVTAGCAIAQVSPPSGALPFPDAGGPPVFTSRGPAQVTGRVGSMESVQIPGSAVGGTLMNNGNGTSTLMIPGGIPEVVPSRR